MQMLGLRGSSKDRGRRGDASPSSSSAAAGATGTPRSPWIPASASSPRSPFAAEAGGEGGGGRPLRLVYCDERGWFRMDPEAVAALQLVKGPVGVVSVCGRARQGKSFILNQVRLPSLAVVESWFGMISVPFGARRKHENFVGFANYRPSEKKLQSDGWWKPKKFPHSISALLYVLSWCFFERPLLINQFRSKCWTRN